MSFSDDAKNARDRMEKFMQEYAAAHVWEAMQEYKDSHEFGSLVARNVDAAVREAVDEYDAACFHKLPGIRAEAYKAGQEDMRERAANALKAHDALDEQGQRIIRSLSVEEK